MSTALGELTGIFKGESSTALCGVDTPCNGLLINTGVGDAHPGAVENPSITADAPRPKLNY